VYRGIAARPFERRFSLADFVEVKHASFEDGLLQIELEREVPDSMKPRRSNQRRKSRMPNRQSEYNRTRPRSPEATLPATKIPRSPFSFIVGGEHGKLTIEQNEASTTADKSRKGRSLTLLE